MYGTSLAANKNLIQTHLENMQMFFRKKKKSLFTLMQTHTKEKHILVKCMDHPLYKRQIGATSSDTHWKETLFL